MNKKFILPILGISVYFSALPMKSDFPKSGKIITRNNAKETLIIDPSFTESTTLVNMLFDLNNLQVSKQSPTKKRAVINFINKESKIKGSQKLEIPLSVLFPTPEAEKHADLILKMMSIIHQCNEKDPKKIIPKLPPFSLELLPILIESTNYLNIDVLLHIFIHKAAKYLAQDQHLVKFFINPNHWGHKLSPDIGNQIAKLIADTNKSIIKYAPITKKPTQPILQSWERIRYLCPKNQFAVTTDAGYHHPRIYNTTTWQCLKDFGSNYMGRFYCLIPSKNLLVKGCIEDSELEFYNIRTWEKTHSLNLEDDLQGLALSKDQKVLIAVDREGSGGGGNIYFWDTETWKCIDKINTGNDVEGVCISPDQQLMATTDGFNLTIWDFNTYTPLKTIDLNPEKNIIDNWVNHIEFSHNQKYLLCEHGEEERLDIYETKNWTLAKTIQTRSNAKCYSFTPDNKFLIAESEDKKFLNFYDLDTLTCVFRQSTYKLNVDPICFSTNKKEFSTGKTLWNYGNVLSIFNLQLPQMLYLLARDKNLVLSSKSPLVRKIIRSIPDCFFIRYLQKAIIKNDIPAVKTLLKLGANPYSHTISGETMVKFAQRLKRNEIVSLLNTKIIDGLVSNFKTKTKL